MARSSSLAAPSLFVLVACAAPAQPPARVDVAPVRSSAPIETAPAPVDTHASCADGRCPPVEPRLALGDYHACAVVNDGRVACWGRNDKGQLGDGATADKSLPVLVPDLPRASDVVAGPAGTCAIVEGGAVWCWGEVAGQTMPTPTRVQGLAQATTVSIGRRHACAVTKEGAASCWGANDLGQLGDGTLEARDKPTPVSKLAGVRALAVGDRHTCAVHERGTACWGAKRPPRGSPNNPAPKPVAVSTPEEVVGLPPMKKLVTAMGNTCGVSAGGDVFCWGSETDSVAAKLDKYANVVAFTMANGRRCALTKDGAVVCDGRSDDGAMGTSTAHLKEPTPIASFGAVSPKALIASGWSSFCLLDEGRIRCTGDNTYGQLGMGDTATFPTARVVEGIDGATSLVVTQHAGCALDKNRRVMCWGEGVSHFAKKDEQTRRTDAHVPRAVRGIDDAKLVVHGASQYEACAVNAKGELSCFNAGNYAYPTDTTSTLALAYQPYKLLGLSGVTYVAPLLTQSAWAVLSNGTVVAYRPGQVRADKAGRRVADAEVVPFNGLTDVVKVVIAERHDFACALRKAGTVACFPMLGAFGGPSGFVAEPKLAEATGIRGAVDIASGGFDSREDQRGKGFMYVRKSDGSVQSFMVSGQKGAPPQISEAKVEKAFKDTTAIGRAHVFCAGTDKGLLCDRRDVFDKDPPREEPLAAFARGEGKVLALDGYMYNTCALLDGGKVACTGLNRGRGVGAPERDFSSDPVFVRIP